MNSKNSKEIAIIGLGCYYPGAKSPIELWENILARRQQFREMPEVRLPNAEYFDIDPLTPDKTYQNKAAVIDGYDFNWLDRRIPKKTYESTDIVHWLALDTALQALADTRYSKETIPTEKTGVILGNTLTGEFTRSNQMLLRWPYVRKTLRASLQQKGLIHLAGELEATMEKYYKSVFAPVTEDTLAGGLANTIAGRICNFLDLHGGGYIVDGACSSSLVAITTAANYLELGQMDLAIAGGVDISLDTFELIGFAKTGALTKDEMRVYDKNGKGFLPGEGCGMVIMKRMEDAIRDNDTIYATLMGWGISSDGKGGITAPSATGQSMALLRAYRKADFDPIKLDFIEGHGTGTTVGDKTELQGIIKALNADKTLPKRNCGVTSFKSIVGHTKAAAGVGAFIKTVMALNQRVLPPTAGLRDFNPIFEDNAKTLYPILFGSKRNPEEILYAGVSAMGFGGINSHTLLRSGTNVSAKLKPTIDERKLMVSNQESEVFVFSADSLEELVHELDLCRYMSGGISYAEMVDFAQYLNINAAENYKYRAAIVARTPFELDRKIELLMSKLENNTKPETIRLEANTIVFGHKNDNLKICAAFPGQGAQRINMNYKLKERFNWVEELYGTVDNLLQEEGFDTISDKLFRPFERVIDQREKLEWNEQLKQTQIAQPAITANSLVWYKYLSYLGINFQYSIGHSLGELSAAFASGKLSEAALIKFAGFRGKIMSECGTGSMASLVCNTSRAEELISQIKGYLTIANINAPEQTVVSGDTEAIEQLIKLAIDKEIAAVKLPVAAAFHSNLIGKASDEILNYKLLSSKRDSKETCKIISTVTAKEIEPDLNLASYFATQACSQVNFIEAVKVLKEKCDIVVEVGPGKVLSGLISSISNDLLSFPVETAANDDISFNTMIANLYVAGANIAFEKLYSDRLIRLFVPTAERKFLVNPLERPLPNFLNIGPVKSTNNQLDYLLNEVDFPHDNIQDYLLERGNFIKEIIASDIKYFRQAKGIASSPIRREVPSQEIEVAEVSASSSGFEQQLYEKIEFITGFPASALKPEMKLLDDLNLDSIKAGTLLSGISKEFGLSGKINPVNYANASLEKIVSDFQPHIPVLAQPVKPAAKSVGHTIKHLVAERTGFPTETISMDFRLLNDLNLDSIKAGTLISELIKNLGITQGINVPSLANSTLSEIENALSPHIAQPDTNAESTKPKTLNIEAIVNQHIQDKTGFSAEHIKKEYRLLDDLNLDSIKANELVNGVLKELGLSGKINAANYANSSIEKLITDLNGIHQKESNYKAPQTLHEVSSAANWVQSYVVETENQQLHITEPTLKAYWKNHKALIVHLSDEQKEFGQKLQKQFSELSGNILLTPASEIEKALSETGADTLFLLVPEGISTSSIKLLTEYLSKLAVNPYLLATNLCFIQFGDGNYSRNTPKEQVKSLSVSAFAASLHLERPSCKIRVLEFSAGTSEKEIAEKAAGEMISDQSYVTAGYSKGKRILMNYKTAFLANTTAKYKLTQNDVVLITGGAKGITAECGLALAEKYQHKTILLGSSKYTPGNKELDDILKRYENAGLKVSYLSCDISDAKKLTDLKPEIEKLYGKITVVIHGAGKNVPRLASSVDEKNALDEIAPKVMGTVNLIDVFKGSELKKFVLFSSIIGITGMKGNAWYAFANETSDRLLRQLKVETGTDTLSLAYSVWSEVGMGARMGSVEALSGMGIGAISPSKGIASFLQSFELAESDQQIVIASKLGGLDTWRRLIPSMPKMRYIDEVAYFEPGAEIESYTGLSRETDLYVDDHNYRGSLLFPTVFGLEAMAQSAFSVAGFTEFREISIENISLLRPIVVPDRGSNKIKIVARQIEQKHGEIRIYTGISTEESNFTNDHFSAEFVFEKLTPGEKINMPSEKPLLLDPKTDLYSWLLFQGKRFQLIDRVYSMSASKTVFTTKKLISDTNELCFSEELQLPFLLGSPLLRDTLLQSFQLSLTQKLVLPVRIKKWRIFKPGYIEKNGLVECSFTGKEGKTYTSNVTFSSAEGNVLESIEGYQVQELGDKSGNPTPEAIAARGIDITGLQLKESCVHAGFEYPIFSLTKHNKLFHTLTIEERHDIEKEILQTMNLAQISAANSNKTFEIEYAESGKPSLRNSDLSLSISHSNTWLFMVAANYNIGCDLEFVQHREVDIWRDLITSTWFSKANELSKQLQLSIDEMATRFWSLREAFFKLTATHPDTFELINSGAVQQIFHLKSNDGFEAYFSSNSIEIFPEVKSIYAFSVNKEKSVEEIKKEPEADLSKITETGTDMFDQETARFKTSFTTSFKDCKSFYGKTYFTNFPIWMGSLREYVLQPIKDKLMKDLRSGDFGMVTNNSGINLYHEAEALDKIYGTLRFTDKCDFDNSYIDLKYEWFKEIPGGKLKIADCYLSTTWVKILDRGIVKQDPIPAYFLEFLNSYYFPKKYVENENHDNSKPLFNENSIGKLIYQSGILPRPQILLQTMIFKTGLINGNTVGNLYYSNYYDWQAESIEEYILKVVPELFPANGKLGEFFCINSYVNHLQEAMPCENIKVDMYLQAVTENSCTFFFEYFSGTQNAWRKLSYGSNTLVWAKRNASSDNPEVSAVPDKLLKEFKKLGI